MIPCEIRHRNPLFLYNPLVSDEWEISKRFSSFSYPSLPCSTFQPNTLNLHFPSSYHVLSLLLASELSGSANNYPKWDSLCWKRLVLVKLMRLYLLEHAIRQFQGSMIAFRKLYTSAPGTGMFRLVSILWTLLYKVIEIRFQLNDIMMKTY